MNLVTSRTRPGPATALALVGTVLALAAWATGHPLLAASTAIGSAYVHGIAAALHGARKDARELHGAYLVRLKGDEWRVIPTDHRPVAATRVARAIRAELAADAPPPPATIPPVDRRHGPRRPYGHHPQE